MSEGNDEPARAATVDDLKRLLAALAAEQVDYVLIGGYALHALGYQRATVDIDLLLRPERDQGERVRRALLTLPDKAAEALDPEWFTEGDTIRVADAFVIDLMFNACGESIESLRKHIVAVDLDGVGVRTLDLEGKLETKQPGRDKDRVGFVAGRRCADRAGAPAATGTPPRRSRAACGCAAARGAPGAAARPRACRCAGAGRRARGRSDWPCRAA